MSISPIFCFLQKSDNLSISITSKPIALPREIWQLILNLITNNPQTSYQQISKIAAVCPFFLYHCLQNCLRFRAPHSLHHRMGNPQKSKPVPIAEKMLYRYQLAIGEDGKKYYSSSSPHNSKIHLIIEDFKGSAFSFLDICLTDLLPSLSEDTYVNFSKHRIVSFHPLQDGFIIVSRRAISRWTLEKSVASLKHFYSLPLDNNCIIISSGIKDNILYITTKNIAQISHLKLNLNKPVAVFLPMTIQEVPTDDFSFLSSGNDLFAFASKAEKRCFTIQESKDESSETLVTGKKILMNDRNFSYVKSHHNYRTTQAAPWLIFLNENSQELYVINLETQNLWINEKLELRFLEFSNNRISFFVSNDFLFIICDSGDFIAFFLPTKKDYTEILTPFLKPYLSKSWRLFSVEFSKDSKKGLILHALLQDSQGTDWFFPEVLTKVEIPLESREPE